MPVTTKKIAEICGVSRGTVDRALNNRPGINPQTREEILKTAESLGYKPDFLGKSLVTGKTKTLGVVVFDVYSRFFGQLVHAIEGRAKELGYFVYLTLTDKDREVEKQCIDHLSSRKVDGLILFPISKGISFDKYLQTLGIPIVTIVNKISKRLDYIGINDYNALFNAVSLLNKYGHNKITYVSTPITENKHTNLYAVDNRLEGFKSACKQLGIPENSSNIVAVSNYVQIVMDSLKQRHPPTAILCSNDIYALEIMKALKSAGYRIPDDISLMGFDNIDALRYIDPGLTTIGYPIEELGRRAVDILVERIDNAESAPPREVILEHKIIERDSVLNILDEA